MAANNKEIDSLKMTKKFLLRSSATRIISLKKMVSHNLIEKPFGSKYNVNDIIQLIYIKPFCQKRPQFHILWCVIDFKKLFNSQIVNKSEEEEEEHIVTFEEFSKINLKIGKIIQAEIIAGMEKILKVKVDVGIDQRDLVVGAALFYRPEELIGKKVVVCTNLKPRKIANIISNGMLLAAEGTGGKPEFLTVTEDIPIGATVH